VSFASVTRAADWPAEVDCRDWPDTVRRRCVVVGDAVRVNVVD
jgi:hypothetical protein